MSTERKRSVSMHCRSSVSVMARSSIRSDGARRVGAGVVVAAAGGAIAIGAMEERLLGGADVARLAAPALERRLLDRARERERQRPRHAAAEARVHRVEMRRRLLRRLAAGKKGDARDGRG